MWNLKRNDTNELTYKTERDSQTKKMNYGWQGPGIVREFGMVTYTLLYLKWITNKDLLYCTGNLLNVMWQPGWEGGLGGEWIHVYVWLVPSLSTWTMTTLSIGYTPIQNKKLKKKKTLSPNTVTFWDTEGYDFSMQIVRDILQPIFRRLPMGQKLCWALHISHLI